MNNLNMANEVLGVIARLALVVRSSVHKCGLDSSGRPTDESYGLYWLGDALHNIGCLHSHIAKGEFDNAIYSCDQQVLEIDRYLSNNFSTYGGYSRANRTVAIETRDLLINIRNVLVQTP